MLHDPKRDRKPSLPGFALFVAGKPRDERYDWQNASRCAVGQYLESIKAGISLSKWECDPLRGMNALAAGRDELGAVRSERWTFGQLSDRILAHQRAETVKAAV